MITVIIGQRGVGKTQLLKRLHRYTEADKIPCLDLDMEIERRLQRRIRDIFEQEGEAAFRDIEKQMFQTLMQENSKAYIAVGAGFSVGIIPESAKVLWVQRPTDERGRIFLDRPRLEKDLTPLEEYQKRSRARYLHYRNAYDQIYMMPEGLFEVDTLEEDILVRHKKPIAGTLTIMPELFVKKHRWHYFGESYANHGVGFFELRDDLLNHEQVQVTLGTLFTEKFIYSFRSGQTDHYPHGPQIHYYDWALELGPLPEPLRFLKQRLIVSLHEQLEDELIESAIQRLNQNSHKSVHLKFAPLIENFEDLLLGHLWQQADPENRSFLPRSEDGRWAWYRQWMKGRQLVNFWREGFGSNPDQPTLFEWQSVHLIKTQFAAILGDPVQHSWTPIEQKNFFEERNEPIFRIKIHNTEWNKAIAVLTMLGLRHAAVTSPLKEEAFHTCQNKSEVAETLRSVNTMRYDNETKTWNGHNTDLPGFKSLAEEAKDAKNIVIWGGGGTLTMIKKVFPQAYAFSATRAEVREEDQARWSPNIKPDLIIWAAPRTNELQWPDPSWQPKTIIDLNYTEDSAGREYAQLCRAEYHSGAKMFRVQAQHQRDYWENQK